MTTNVTIARFTNNLNDENAVAFSWKIYLVLSGHGWMEIISNTLFVKFMMKENSIFKNLFFFCSLVYKIFTTPARGVPNQPSDKQRRVSFCPLK